MTAPPTVDERTDEAEQLHDSTPAVPLAECSMPDLDEDDPRQAMPDPADSVVPIGELPPLVAPVNPRDVAPRTGPTDRLRGWLVTLFLTAIGGFVRFWNLGYAVDGGGPGEQGTPLFDEKYYAVQAAEVLRNGGVEDNQSFGVVVHPPLGKQLIGIGEWLFGYTPFGWRFASAVAATIIIALTIRVVRRMTGSTLIGGIAGILIICDSVSHVLGRAALLDVFCELFVLAAFCCLIADRDQVRARLQAAAFDGFLTRRPGRWVPFQAWAQRSGIALGARWWRFACGVLLGLATGIKYSGIYYVAAFGIITVIWDITARRAAGVRHPVTAVVRRDLLPNLWSLAVVPIAVYIGTWWAWLFSETGYPRHLYCADPGAPCGSWSSKSGFWEWLAGLWHNSLWQWTWKMLDFHSTLLTPTNPADRHPWESKPWSWPMGTRPVLTYVAEGQPCGDGTNGCVGRIFIAALPAMWWLSFFIAAWALWRAIGRLDWRFAAVLVGYGAGYLPWFANLDRQMYFFYVAPLAPFLIIGISLVLGDILGKTRVGIERRFLVVAVVALYVGLVVADFMFMWPILNGTPITSDELQMRIWLPSLG